MLNTPDSYGVQFQRESYERVAPDPTQWPILFGKVNGMAFNGFSDEQLRSIEAPFLIAGGDHDVVGGRLEHLLETTKRIPNAQLAIVPDAGHFILNDDPQKLLPIVETFLDEPISTVAFATPAVGYHAGVSR